MRVGETEGEKVDPPYGEKYMKGETKEETVEEIVGPALVGEIVGVSVILGDKLADEAVVLLSRGLEVAVTEAIAVGDGKP